MGLPSYRLEATDFSIEVRSYAAAMAAATIAEGCRKAAMKSGARLLCAYARVAPYSR
jgi:hypothetical protein